MSKKSKRRWGDRKDATLVREIKGLQGIMGHLWPNRTDCEVYLHDTIDATALMEYLNKKNEGRPKEEKITIFHCAVAIIARIIKERPEMNRFIQGRRMYQRNEITISFVAKRQFKDGADEALIVLRPKDSDTLESISKKIRGDVHEQRKHEHAVDGVDKIMDNLVKLPMPLLALIVRIIRYLDFWGINPDFLTEGDPNYSTVTASNLGSIGGPAVYHHLSNYGTCSILLTLGTLHKEEMLQPDGTRKIRDVVDIGATLDERIGDGFYFVRSLKLIRYIFAHPEILDWTLDTPSGFDYK